ncbi:hypothetical protein DSC45_34660 [Streptomyces sp. YIM 130001]|nr:hypothetical protein DSC45_34660 [Streptomyces sp. YIM 130001]
MPRSRHSQPTGGLCPAGRARRMYPVSRSSSRLGLRELTHEDAEPVFAIYGNAAATEHLSFEPRTRDQVEQIVARSIGSATETTRTDYALAVVERVTDTLIGFGRIATDPHQQRGATLGFALRPDIWGRATASRPYVSSSASDSRISNFIASGAHAPPTTKHRHELWPPREWLRRARSVSTSTRLARGVTPWSTRCSTESGRSRKGSVTAQAKAGSRSHVLGADGRGGRRPCRWWPGSRPDHGSGP